MANRYWVGGTGNWTDTAHWSATNGGSGGVAIPTSSDDVYITSLSGFGSGGTISEDGTSVVCNNFSSQTGHNYSINYVTRDIKIYGSYVGESGLTWTTNSWTQFYGTGNHTITTNGGTLYYLTIYGSGTYTLEDDLTTIEYFDQNSGTFDANDYNVSTKGIYIYGGAIYMRSGLFTINYTWAVSALNSTIYCGTSTIKFININTSNATFAGAGKIYNNVWFDRGVSTGNIRISGSNTFNEFKDTGTEAHSILFIGLTDQNISSLNINGSSGKLITLTSTNTDKWRISDTTGTNSVNYCNISYSQAEGGATWEAFTLNGNVDGGNNTGWYFSPNGFFQLF